MKGNTVLALPTPMPLLQLAAALSGDEVALREIAATPHRSAAAIEHRLAPALYRRASRVQPPISLPQAWRTSFQRSTARHMLFEQHLRSVAQHLGKAGVAWLPIKGLDLCSRTFEFREDRPAGDIDILIRRQDLSATRDALNRAGWQDAFGGPRYERFLRDEGYCWLAAQPDGCQLEVHFRFWGTVPEGYEEELFGRSLEDPLLGPSARRPSLDDAYLLTAVHAWMSPPPRPLIHWWDLESIAAHSPQKNGKGISRLAARWQLQLPVAIAASQTAALWPRSFHGDIAGNLSGSLRRAEKRSFHRARIGGSDAVTLAGLTFARLLARRPSRSGWRALGRRVWAHPGVVARETPERWSWPRRRLGHLWRRLGLPGPGAIPG